MIRVGEMINLKWKGELSGAAARTGKVSKKRMKRYKNKKHHGFYRNYKKSI